MKNYNVIVSFKNVEDAIEFKKRLIGHETKLECEHSLFGMFLYSTELKGR